MSAKALPRVLLCLGVCLVGLAAAAEQALELSKTVALPGVKGRFDHFATDLRGGRIFVAALANDSLEVFDPASGLRIQSVPGLRKPTGVLFLPALGRLFVACGDDGTFRAFEGKPLRPTGTLTGLDDADNVRYDAAADLIYLGFGSGGLAVIRPAALEKAGEMGLPGHPESFQLEKNGPRIFVNVPDARRIVVLDRVRKTTLASWPMETFQENFPMALDDAGHRLFVGCRRPPRLVVLDTQSGATVADLEISGDVDDLFFDPARDRLYASCGEGYLDIISRLGLDKYARLERLPTSKGSRTCFFSPELSRLFLAVPDMARPQAEIRVFDVR